jgi:hypothetical protein
MPKNLFISATGQNVGKTTFSLGLISALIKKGLKVGYIKPMGQRYVIVEGHNVDEDSLLIKKACNLSQTLKDLSPIAIEKGFSEKYVMNPHKKELEKTISESFKNVSKDKDVVVIEGTGHTGVGSVFDFSNADMAKFLGSKVLLIAEGGIGNTIDKLVLNKALFEQKGVEVVGVVANKVIEEKMDKIKKILPLALKRQGLKKIAILPFKKLLSSPTLEQIHESLGYKVLNKGDSMKKPVGRFVVGVMAAQSALKHTDENTAIITSADIDDIVITQMIRYIINKKELKKHLSGIIITGDSTPSEKIIEDLKKSGVTLLRTRSDTYTSSLKIQKLIVKIMPFDEEKIHETFKLVENNIDIEGLLKFF